MQRLTTDYTICTTRWNSALLLYNTPAPHVQYTLLLTGRQRADIVRMCLVRYVGAVREPPLPEKARFSQGKNDFRNSASVPSNTASARNSVPRWLPQA